MPSIRVLAPRDRAAVNQATQGLARDFQSVRLEAIRRNEFVGLHVIPGEDRYVVFVNTDRFDADFDDGTDPVIKEVDMAAGGVQITNANGGPIIFDPRGINPNGFIGEIAVSLANRAATYATSVCVTAQGRTRIVASATCGE